MSVVGWTHSVVTAGITVTSVIVGIQYNKITMIISVVNKTNTVKKVNRVTAK